MECLGDLGGLTMEFGVFHEFPRSEGQSDAEAFDLGLEIVDRSEDWGLDVMWLAELHVRSDSVISSPVAVAANLAARAQRMRIGMAVQILPLVNPLRLAEEWATVDQLSKGRVIFGVGRSGFARTYEAYGIPYAESRERFAEALEIIKLAWTQPSFSYQGTWHSYRDVSLMPRPYQQPHPPIRVAATSSDTCPIIGSQGYPIFVAVRNGTIADLGPDLRAYREAYRAAGHLGEGTAFLRIPVYVADTPRRADEEPQASMMAFYRGVAERLSESAGGAGILASERREERGQALERLTWEGARREKVIVGTPDMVIARLQELREQVGLNGILAELNCGGEIPHAQVLRSLQLLCTEVMPAFRQPAQA